MTSRYRIATTFCFFAALFGCQKSGNNLDSSVSIISPEIASLDITSPGSYRVVQSHYGSKVVAGKTTDLDTRMDPLVVADRVTDLRGAMWMPTPRSDKERFPLLIFLHGNHNTCVSNENNQEDSHYSWTGECRPSFREIPSFKGYEYLAQHMASHGYIVVSINANRGINGWDLNGGYDWLLIEARGRLVLKHLAWLKKWHDGTRDSRSDIGLDLKDRIDFSQVGLMGHSRGGEGVRAAISLYQSKDSNSYAKDLGAVTFQGVFEFAPVDLYGPKPYDAPGVPWTVVIGSCDGDIKDFAGAGTFRRRRQMGAGGVFSSVYIVPGANHNFFNTQWQYSDAETCGTAVKPMFSFDAKGSDVQKQVGLLTLSAFFRGFVGKNPQATQFQKVFDPQYQPPKQMAQIMSPLRESLTSRNAEQLTLIADLEEAKSTTAKRFVEDFGPGEWGGVNLKRAQRQVLSLTWNQASTSTIFDTTAWEKPRNLSGTWILSLGLARFQSCYLRGFSETCDKISGSPTDIGISLVMADGSASAPVRLKNYVSLSETMNAHVSIAQCPTPFTLSNAKSRCEANSAKGGHSCSRLGGYLDESNTCVYEVKEGFKHALIFQEVPIELKDFKGVSLDAVKGIRLIFDGSAGGTLLLDQTITLRKSQD